MWWSFFSWRLPPLAGEKRRLNCNAVPSLIQFPSHLLKKEVKPRKLNRPPLAEVNEEIATDIVAETETACAPVSL